MFDLVVPVYNSMHHARACIESIYAHANLPFHLYVVDDCSDDYTRTELISILSRYDASSYTLTRNSQNKGYLQSVNFAISQGDQPNVILINSDTVMTPGFLEKVKLAFDSDEKIGVINPVSTWANWTRIPFPNGYTISELAKEVDKRSLKQLPDINNASGFFFAVRRRLYDELGMFDIVYDPGYYEEADFCMRAIEAGYRVVVDDSLYIFHYGWGSFMAEGRNENMRKNRITFMERWEEKYKLIEQDWKNNNPIEALQSHLERSDVWKEQESEQNTHQHITPSAAMHLLREIENDPAAAKRLIDNTPLVSRKEQRAKKIIYILPKVALYGGIISVLQVVNRLVAQGQEVNIATYGTIDEEIHRLFPLYFRPYVFPDMATMLADFPECDLVVATHWSTVYPALVARYLRGVDLAYFVQDYEADFYSESQAGLAEKARRTYDYIPHQIVKTRWLKNKLQDFDNKVDIIPLGLNLDIFHDKNQKRELQIVGMARPSSERRNFAMLKKVYSELHKQCPELTLAVYGIGYSPEDFDCPVKDYGTLSDMKQVSNALNDSTILLDPSTFQGFGRPGLEAMACGTAAVLTRAGGITEYAKHEYNCLLIDPSNCDEIVAKVISLVKDEAKRNRLVANGHETAKRFSYVEEGVKTKQFLQNIIAA
jgi:GT2 family glycosyltransferase/glycosyltransferase involved in cell wall biosynthesis